MRTQRDKSKYTGDAIQLVTFKLGRETFSVNVNQVREIGKVEEITHVPKMPEFIEGVMNLRGQITTVIDLRRRFGIATSSPNANATTTANANSTANTRSNQERIIVVEIGDNQLGIIVDAVQDVMRISPEHISPPPKMISSNVNARFLTGICKLPNQLIMLLDLSKVLSEEEIEHVFEESMRQDIDNVFQEA